MPYSSFAILPSLLSSPLKMVKKYTGRIKHVHLKDIRKEVVEKVKAENLSFLDGVRLGTFTVPGDLSDSCASQFVVDWTRMREA